MMLDRTDTAERRYPHGDRHVDFAAGAGPVLRQVADHLIEGGIGESVELDLGDRYEAPQRQADGDADDRGLGQRGIETALLAECCGQSLGDPENSAERCDVLTENQHPVVGGHRVVQCPVERLRPSSTA